MEGRAQNFAKSPVIILCIFLQKHVFLNEINNHNQLGNDLVLVTILMWLAYKVIGYKPQFRLGLWLMVK